MKFGLLGPLLVSDDAGEPVVLRAGIPRTLLAALLLDANTVRSVDQLADVIWEQRRPAAAAASLHNHVMRLRRQLGPVIGARIRTEAPGYRLVVADGELDLQAFADLCERGRQAARAEDWATTSALLTEALALWRGAPCPDLAGIASVAPELHRLDEARIDALRERVNADLWLGRHHELVGELQRLVAEHPLVESFHGQLMLALYRGGRQAEALETYRRLHRRLTDELGVEPSRQLRELHQDILKGDTDLQAPTNRPAGVTRVLAQLPADTHGFAGRESQVRALREVFTARRDGTEPVAVAAITGPGGIGKTALALRVAHLVAAEYPDGQVYVDLRGASEKPRVAAEVLVGLLRDLGEPDDAVPCELEALAARFRSLTARRRMLIMLDNARDTTQIRPLLPGSGFCGVLVTSRSRLPGLVGALPVHLSVLTTDEARQLFTTMVGAERVRADPVATNTVLTCCAGLPLAVRIAASRLAARPSWTVATLADRLADERRRLDELAVEDMAVRVSFQTSYASLSEHGHGGGALPAERAFRLLSLFPGRDFGAPAAAALLDLPLHDASDVLETLVDANLLESPVAGRYRFHDLLLAFAKERAHEEESADTRQAALRRLAGWYLYVTHQAIGKLRARSPVIDVSGVAFPRPPVEIAGQEQAFGWFETERNNLLDITRLAATEDLGAFAWLMPRCLYSFYMLYGCWAEIIEVNTIGMRRAREAGDKLDESRLMRARGETIGRHYPDRVEAGLDDMREAARMSEEMGDLKEQAHCIASMADTLAARDRLAESLEAYQHALRLARQVDSPYDLAHILNNTAYDYCITQQYTEAVQYAREALEILAKTSARDAEAATLDTLGVAYHGLGELDQAIATLREAVAAFGEIADRHLGADSLDHLAAALLDAGERDEARQAWQRAAQWFDETAPQRAARIRTRISQLAATGD
jgi:DNA-binding SARP family transcriptional activator/tetratricopeptide (TPR) repeat protein